MKQQIPSWPLFSGQEIAAAGAVLASGRTNYWAGEEGRSFEREFADFVGVRHAIALANGTLALEYALQALGLGAGDEVVVSPRSFVASAACVARVGATPVFADVDGYSQNISAATVAAELTPNTRAIVCVHLGGFPCAMLELQELARKHNLWLVEDCAQAHGASVAGRSVGSFGDVAAWSFCQDKIISCAGEGGMLTTDDQRLWRRVWQLKDHGKSPELTAEPHSGHSFRWLHESLGSNGRMTEMQAAIGRIQLVRLPSTLELRQRNAELLAAVCRRYSPIRLTELCPQAQPAWYRFYCFIPTTSFRPGHSRASLLAAINALGFPAFEGSCPEIYREAAFASYQVARQPAAARLGEQSLALLVHPNISLEQMQAYAATLDTCLQQALATSPGA